MAGCPCGSGYTVTQPLAGDGANQLLWKIAQSLAILSGQALPSGTPGTNTSSFAVAPDITVLVAGTAVAGLDIPTPRGVALVARSTNVGSVYVGGVGVTKGGGGKQGIELLQGGSPAQVLLVSNLNQVYVNADNGGDRVGVVIL